MGASEHDFEYGIVCHIKANCEAASICRNLVGAR